MSFRWADGPGHPPILRTKAMGNDNKSISIALSRRLGSESEIIGKTNDMWDFGGFIRKYWDERGTRQLPVVTESRNSLWIILQAPLEQINCGRLVKDGRVNDVPVFHDYSQNPYARTVHNVLPLAETRIRLKLPNGLFLTASEQGTEGLREGLHRFFWNYSGGTIRANLHTFNVSNRLALILNLN